MATEAEASGTVTARAAATEPVASPLVVVLFMIVQMFVWGVHGFFFQ